MNYTVTIKKLLQEQVNIFDFDYLFYKEENKKAFEEKFINLFYTEEIGFETVALFKRYLKGELNRLFPYYEHLYKTTIQTYGMLENYSLEETITRDIDNTTNMNGDSNSTTTNDGNSTDYDTPRSNLNSPSYKTSNNNNSTNNNSTNSNTTSKGKETSKRLTKGNIGVQTSQDLIEKERKIIINIDDLILNELSCLFMGVYDI